MDRETYILKDRVQIATFNRCWNNARKWIGSENDEGQKGSSNPALNAKNVRTQGFWQIAGKGCNQRTEETKNQHPQQHRAFMIAPNAGNFIKHRLLRMGVFDHVKDRKVRDDIGECQNHERERNQRKDGQCSWYCNPHQLHVSTLRTYDRRDRLNH